MANYKEIMEYIDNLDIHEKEYDAIRLLLDNSDPRFFTKIIEEVVDGNLFWVDFYPLLDMPEYVNNLKDTFKSQKDLAYMIKNFTEYRKSLGLSTYNKIGVTKGETGYDDMVSDDTNNRINNLLQVEANDNIYTLSCKTAIYNAVENYKYLISDENNNDDNDRAYVDNFGELIYNGSAYDENSGLAYDYLNPEDILFSQDDIIIPIEYRYQTISASDRDFMAEHGISEEYMKKLKSLSIFIKKNANITGGDQ